MNPFIIKRLNSSHKEKIKEHFLRLDKESRYSRFCFHIKDENIVSYVEKIKFDDNGIFGIFDEKLNIIGLGECVVDPKIDLAEVAFSVEPGYQGNGLGSKLMERIVRFAKSKGKHHLEMNCLRTNQKSMYIAKKFGLQVQHQMGGESIATIDMKDTVPEIENINEKVEDSLAYYALQQRTNLNNYKKTQELFFETITNVCKMFIHKFIKF